MLYGAALPCRRKSSCLKELGPRSFQTMLYKKQDTKKGKWCVGMYCLHKLSPEWPEISKPSDWQTVLHVSLFPASHLWVLLGYLLNDTCWSFLNPSDFVRIMKYEVTIPSLNQEIPYFSSHHCTRFCCALLSGTVCARADAVHSDITLISHISEHKRKSHSWINFICIGKGTISNLQNESFSQQSRLWGQNGFDNSAEKH